jgi:hypothetical protein
MRRFAMHTIASSELCVRGKRWWQILAVSMALAPAALPQGIGGMGGGMGGGMPSMLGGTGENGFGFYGVAAFAEYTSSTVPFNAIVPVAGLNLGPNYLAGGSASMGWMNIGGRTNAHVTYNISYNASLRYSSWNTLNHFLNFGVTHDVSPRLTTYFSGTAATMRWDQFLFEPTVLSEVAGTPSTFDELVSAILSGKYTNSQLASILTGAPTLESPAATLLYGTQFFTSSLRTGIGYELTSRLHFHADAGGSRTQHLNTDTPQLNGVYLVPSTTSASATMGVGYSLTPFTTIGLEATGSRTFSHFEDVYTVNGVVTANHVLGRHWIVSGRGGTGTFVPVRQTFRYKPGLHYVAGGGITYKSESQSIILNYNHTIADTSGIGAESSDSGSGTWQVHLPGQKWGVFARGSYTSLTGSSLSNIHAWLGGGGIYRMLNRHTNATLAYMYGRSTGTVEGFSESRPLQAVNLMISWTPRAAY